MLQQRTYRVVALAAVAVLLAGATIAGAVFLTRPHTTDGAATTAAPTRLPAPSLPSSTPPVPLSSGPSSPPTATISSAPGANALALAGTGIGRGQFTPAAGSWALHTTYSCQAGAVPFRLVVTDAVGAAVVTTQGPTSGDDRRTVTGAGLFALEVSGGCSWIVEATG